MYVIPQMIHRQRRLTVIELEQLTSLLGFCPPYAYMVTDAAGDERLCYSRNGLDFSELAPTLWPAMGSRDPRNRIGHRLRPRFPVSFTPRSRRRRLLFRFALCVLLCVWIGFIVWGFLQ